MWNGIFPHQDGRHLASLAQREGGELAEFSVTPEQWGNFLCTLFDEWVKEDVGDYYIQLFDSTLANWVGDNREYAPWQNMRTRRRNGIQRRRLLM